MPYTTERGVRMYHDYETPLEFADGNSELAHQFNEARDAASRDAEALYAILDERFEDGEFTRCAKMQTLAAKIADALAYAKEIV
jgi:hypothetical protein